MATTHPVLTRPDRYMYLYRITIVWRYLHTMQCTATIYTAHPIPVWLLLYYYHSTVYGCNQLPHLHIYLELSLIFCYELLPIHLPLSLLSHQPRPAWVSAQTCLQGSPPTAGQRRYLDPSRDVTAPEVPTLLPAPTQVLQWWAGGRYCYNLSPLHARQNRAGRGNGEGGIGQQMDGRTKG
jgi:hypothetical protein